jgi:hypothetical protein
MIQFKPLKYSTLTLLRVLLVLTHEQVLASAVLKNTVIWHNPTFQRNMSPSSSDLKSQPKKQPASRSYSEATRSQLYVSYMSLSHTHAWPGSLYSSAVEIAPEHIRVIFQQLSSSEMLPGNAENYIYVYVNLSYRASTYLRESLPLNCVSAHHIFFYHGFISNAFIYRKHKTLRSHSNE